MHQGLRRRAVLALLRASKANDPESREQSGWVAAQLLDRLEVSRKHFNRHALRSPDSQLGVADYVASCIADPDRSAGLQGCTRTLALELLDTDD